MRRSEKVEATLTAEEKEILQRLCDEAGCTEAELIRSVLISRSISLDDLETGKKIEHEKNKALHNCKRKHAPRKWLFGGFCGRDSGIGPAQRAKTTIWN